MTNNQNYLWNRILSVNNEINETKDALAKWESTLLLQVLIRQLKDDMGEAAYRNFIESSRKMLSPV